MIALTLVEELGTVATGGLLVLLAVALAVLLRRGLLIRIRREEPDDPRQP